VGAGIGISVLKAHYDESVTAGRLLAQEDGVRCVEATVDVRFEGKWSLGWG
jgi:hypothetical protein